MQSIFPANASCNDAAGSFSSMSWMTKCLKRRSAENQRFMPGIVEMLTGPKMTKIKVEVYTDGACRGNPGPGGWGVLLRYNGVEKTLYGAEPQTTNNQMELTAAIKGLNAITRPCEVVLVTDSQYVKKGITEWITNWRTRNWKGSNGKHVKNVELWQQLDAAAKRHTQVKWEWVRGHTGHPENERADELANQAIDELLKG